MNILVAVDESPAGLRALQWAAGLAARTTSDLQAVRTWAYPHIPADGLEDADHMDRRVLRELRETVAGLDQSDVAIDTVVLRGPAGPALLSFVETHKPSLMVVGRRGPDTPRTLLGSVSRRLVEQAHIPVAVVSGEDTNGRPALGRIAVGVDGSSNSTRALQWAIDLAAKVGADLVLVNAVGFDPEVPTAVPDRLEASTTVLEDAAALVRASGVEVEVVSVPGDARLVVEEVATERNADLIVVGTRGLGKLGQLLLGSVAGYLAQHVTRPVVVIPPAP
jgi:nucleotide-binding universal stress UspA family protein